MLSTLLVAVAIGQAPAAPTPRPAVAATRADERAQLIARRKVKRTGRYINRVNREAAQAQADAKALAEAKAEFERTLPARLELNRQMLQRQTDIERNMILQRMAGAAERQAGYVYPGQSPTQGPFR